MRIIGGEARGRKLIGPRDRKARPPLDRIRESVFSILEGDFEGERVLDLFAGVGSFGLEAVSRGARNAVFVELDRGALEVLRSNVRNLGFHSRCELLAGDALSEPDLSSSDGGFALVFLDPPFKMFRKVEASKKVYQRVEAILESQALLPGGVVVLRQPAQVEGACPIEPRETRAYGESVVLFFEASAERPSETPS